MTRRRRSVRREARLRGAVAAASIASVALIAAGCTGTSSDSRPTPTPTPTSRHADGEQQPLAGVVDARNAELLDVRVTRDADRLTVRSLWRCVDRCAEPGMAIAESDDGFTTRELRPGSWKNVQALFPTAYDDLPSRLPEDLGDHDAQRVPVLGGESGRVALAGGEYDAAYFPFARAWRSDDDGRSWQTFEVAAAAGATPYSAGHAVLPDGRLLSAVPWWSDDRAGETSDRPRGLVVSDGDDWAALEEFRASFEPPLEAPREGWAAVERLGGSVEPDPVLWARSGPTRVYVSTDDGETFREIATR